jgi:cold shock CspA family protein
MERMEREQGTLIHWDDDKGYGFLRSNNGKKDTFLHIKSLPPYQRRPQIGDVLTYEIEVDEGKGRLHPLPKSRGWPGLILHSPGSFFPCFLEPICT